MAASLEPFFKEIKKYIENNPNRGNQWFSRKYYSVYIRIGQRLIDGKITKTLELANISVTKPILNKSLFLLTLRFLESFPNYTVFIENIIEPRLIPLVKRMGYTQIESYNDTTPCFYKKL